MSPILGIWASSRLVATDTGAMFPLQVITVGPAGASEVNFTNIPNAYTHLQVRTFIRSAGSDASYQHLSVQFNSDTGNNYYGHGLYGTGASVATHNDGSLTSKLLSYNIPTTTQTASTFNGGVIDILDYANTNKFKVIRGLGGFDSNGAGALGLYSGNWNSTSAITSIQLKVYQGSNFSQYSQFALYGIKAAS